MAFNSILFENAEDNMEKETTEIPEFFTDLNIDQIVDSITYCKDEYNLKPFFYMPLKNINEVMYRQEVFKDLENVNLFKKIKSFSEKMHIMRENIVQSDKLSYKYQKEDWFLCAVEIYCDAVNCLANDLNTENLKSKGLLEFKQYAVNYTKSPEYMMLINETNNLKKALTTVKYTMLIKDNSIKVRKYTSEDDYGLDVVNTFERFKSGAVKSYESKFSDYPDMNHVEAGILDLVAQLYPDIFLNLDNYYIKNSNYIDDKIKNFDREIQFYISYLEHIEKFKKAGLKFCYPKVSDVSKEIYDYDGFDLALANKLIYEETNIICNDFYMKDKERIYVVSGPNQGGKTTFARMFGQLNYLSALGCLVPGKDAKLFLFDNIFTHFEREENIKNLSGKLQDDLIRIYDILKKATPNSIIIMNEIFTSTTLKDALFLGKEIMKKIIDLDLLCVYVTFVEELSSMSEKIVSMVSTTFPDKPELRTYKVIRKPADGLSYAISIAEKYHLTYDCIKERLK